MSKPLDMSAAERAQFAGLVLPLVLVDDEVIELGTRRLRRLPTTNVRPSGLRYGAGCYVSARVAKPLTAWMATAGSRDNEPSGEHRPLSTILSH